MNTNMINKKHVYTFKKKKHVSYKSLCHKLINKGMELCKSINTWQYHGNTTEYILIALCSMYTVITVQPFSL